MTSLYRKTIRLAYEMPDLQPLLLPLLKRAREKDPERRKEAETIYKLALKALKDLERVNPKHLYDKLFWRDGSPPALVFTVKDIPGDLFKYRKISIGIDVLAKKDSYFVKNDSQFGITGPYIQISPMFRLMDEEETYKTPTPEVVDRLYRALRSRRDHVVHELTHFIDYIRLGHESYESAASKGRERPESGDMTEYYNSPVEMNAYFHQAATQYRKAYDEDKKQGEFILSNYFFQPVSWMWEKFLEYIPREAWKNLTPENKKRFQKRAAQMFLRLRRETAEYLKPVYEEELQEALASGDADALEWDVPRLREHLQRIRRMGIR